MDGEQNHTTWAAPGGDYQHMHDVLDPLTPAQAMEALEHEFPGCHAKLCHNPEAVWAEIPDTGFGIHEPNAVCMWQALAAEVHRKRIRVIAHAASTA